MAVFLTYYKVVEWPWLCLLVGIVSMIVMFITTVLFFVKSGRKKSGIYIACGIVIGVVMGAVGLL